MKAVGAGGSDGGREDDGEVAAELVEDVRRVAQRLLDGLVLVRRHAMRRSRDEAVVAGACRAANMA